MDAVSGDNTFFGINLRRHFPVSENFPGLGFFLDVSVMRLEVSLGNLIGFHIDYNLNTGVGARNGKEWKIHLLGF